jgi:hypothetical protein
MLVGYARVHEGAEPSASGLPPERAGNADLCRPAPSHILAWRHGSQMGHDPLGRKDRCSRPELGGELGVATAAKGG